MLSDICVIFNGNVVSTLERANCTWWKCVLGSQPQDMHIRQSAVFNC